MGRPHNLCLVTRSFCDYLGKGTTEQEKGERSQPIAEKE